MKYSIEEIPRQRIAYIRRVGPYGDENSRLMKILKRWAEITGLLNEATVILGVARDDPAITLPGNCRYDACITVSEEYDSMDTGISVASLPGGRYAVFTLIHTAAAMQTAWSEIFGDLTNGGHCVDNTRPIMERYAANMVANHLCELCVPVL